MGHQQVSTWQLQVGTPNTIRSYLYEVARRAVRSTGVSREEIGRIIPYISQCSCERSSGYSVKGSWHEDRRGAI